MDMGHTCMDFHFVEVVISITLLMFDSVSLQLQ